MVDVISVLVLFVNMGVRTSVLALFVNMGVRTSVLALFVTMSVRTVWKLTSSVLKSVKKC